MHCASAAPVPSPPVAMVCPFSCHNYELRYWLLACGIAAAGNIGAVVDGFVFPGLAQSGGCQRAALAVIPLLEAGS